MRETAYFHILTGTMAPQVGHASRRPPHAMLSAATPPHHHSDSSHTTSPLTHARTHPLIQARAVGDVWAWSKRKGKKVLAATQRRSGHDGGKAAGASGASGASKGEKKGGGAAD